MKTDVCLERNESVQGLRCVEMNTSLLPLVDVGMYNTYLSPERFEEQEQCDYIAMGRSREEFVCQGGFDCNAYRVAVENAALDYIYKYAMPLLRIYGVAAIQTDGIDSPREYNFATDELRLKVYLTPDFDVRMRGHIEEFSKNASMQRYIEDHFWSKSGFWSWMPKSLDEILAMDDEERCIGAYLTLALYGEGYINDYCGALYESNFDISDAISCSGQFQFTDFYLYVSDELHDLYVYHEEELNNLLWDVYFRIGRPWRNHQPKNSDYVGECKCEAVEFLLWAADNGYGVKELRELAA